MSMASKKGTRVPTPAEIEKQIRNDSKGQFGFSDILRALALGVSPNAPRLPEQAFGGQNFYGGYQKGYTGIGQSRGGSLTFSMLRQLSERSSLLSAIVTTRKFQATRFARVARSSKHNEVGFRVSHKRATDQDFKVPDGFNDLCREAESMLEKPWHVYWNEGVVYRQIEPTLASFISKTMEDHLVLNRPCVELGTDMYGVPRAFGAIDGANVIPTFAALKFLAAKTKALPNYAWHDNYAGMKDMMQLMSDHYEIDITEKTEYIYLLQGRPVKTFNFGQLLIAPFLPSSDIAYAGYPRSLTETAVFTILAEIMAMSSNLRYFQSGNMTEVLLTMKGNYDDEHVQQLTQILQANMSGIEGMFRVPLVALPDANDLNVMQLKQNHKDMLFDFYIQKLTNLACAVFRMHPSEINEAPRAGDNTGTMQQASQEKQISMAQEQGLESSLNHFKTEIFDPILQRIHPDLCLEWEFGRNEMEVVQLATAQATFTTVNERRKIVGLDPIPEEQGGEVIDNQFIQAKNQAAQQQEMQQQQQEQGAQPGQPGQPEQQNESEAGQDEFTNPPF